MDDHKTIEKLGLTDDEFAVHPTVFAADALKDQVVRRDLDDGEAGLFQWRGVREYAVSSLRGAH
jgi:hypothetical protein